MSEQNLPVLAIIAPCYNEEVIAETSAVTLLDCLQQLISTNQISENSYISVIDDGSDDLSYTKLSEISQNNKHLKVIKLLYNVGHQKSLLCGICENTADIYVTLDFDLQDDINIISQMISDYKEKEVDIVYTVRTKRVNDSFFKRFTAELYYKLLNLIGAKSLQESADFRLFTNDVANFIRQIKETNLYIRGLLFENKFKYSIIKFERKKGIGGTAKFGIVKLLDLSICGILNSSKFPVRFLFILSILSMIFSFMYKNLILFALSINLLGLAIVGEYMVRIYFEVKGRPSFIVKDKINY